MVSISITVLKALEERLEMGARKFPAAPALFHDCQHMSIYNFDVCATTIHNEVNTTQFLDCPLDSFL